MKIAVTGAHRTGKTTLVEELERSLPGYVVSNEAYYQLESEGHVFSEIPTLEDFILLLEYSMTQITENEFDVIFDRCPIDWLAYLIANGEIDKTNLSTLYQKVENVISEIDLLVFVPIEEPDIIGCPESELPQLRNQVNEILYDLVGDFDIETIEVNGSLAARIKQVMEHIPE